MKRRAALVAVALLLAGCSVSSESNGTPSAASGPPPTLVDQLPATSAPADPTTIPVSTAPPAGTTTITTTTVSTSTTTAGGDIGTIAPPVTSDASTTTGPTIAAPPATVSPRVAAAEPTAGVTVVHVGWDLAEVWTPLAIWDGAAWQSSEDVVAVPASTFDTVSVVGLRSQFTGLAYSDATDAVCIDDRRGPLLAFDGAPPELAGGDGYRAVSVAANWDVQPRPVSRSGLDSIQYQQIGESIVAAAGVDPSGGDVTDVVRVDLDGDGMQEVFVTFEKITDGGGAPGDYVVIYGRFPKPSGTVTDSVLFEYYPEAWTSRPTIGRAELLAIGDFNGDSIMEVVLSSRFWDSTLAELLVFDGGTTMRPVGFTGCSL